MTRGATTSSRAGGGRDGTADGAPDSRIIDGRLLLVLEVANAVDDGNVDTLGIGVAGLEAVLERRSAKAK